GLFDEMAKLADQKPPQEFPVKLMAQLGREQLQIGGRSIARIDFSANVALRRQQLSIPSVVAYDAPGVMATERETIIEKGELEKFEITSSSNRVWVTVDLSSIEPLPNCKFHSVDFHFTRTISMRGFDVIAPPKMKIKLQEVLLRSAPIW